MLSRIQITQIRSSRGLGKCQWVSNPPPKFWEVAKGQAGICSGQLRALIGSFIMQESLRTFSLGSLLENYNSSNINQRKVKCSTINSRSQRSSHMVSHSHLVFSDVTWFYAITLFYKFTDETLIRQWWNVSPGLHRTWNNHHSIVHNKSRLFHGTYHKHRYSYTHSWSITNRPTYS